MSLIWPGIIQMYTERIIFFKNIFVVRCIDFFLTYGLKSKQGVTHMDSHGASSETASRGGTRPEVLKRPVPHKLVAAIPPAQANRK